MDNRRYNLLTSPSLTVQVLALGLLIALGSCGGFIPNAGAGGPIPLDSARAVAVAQRNVCGQPMPPSDTTCMVRGYRHADGRYLVTLDRRPPAGKDRVIVALSTTERASW